MILGPVMPMAADRVLNCKTRGRTTQLQKLGPRALRVVKRPGTATPIALPPSARCTPLRFFPSMSSALVCSPTARRFWTTSPCRNCPRADHLGNCCRIRTLRTALTSGACSEIIPTLGSRPTPPIRPARFSISSPRALPVTWIIGSKRRSKSAPPLSQWWLDVSTKSLSMPNGWLVHPNSTQSFITIKSLPPPFSRCLITLALRAAATPHL